MTRIFRKLDFWGIVYAACSQKPFQSLPGIVYDACHQKQFQFDPETFKYLQFVIFDMYLLPPNCWDCNSVDNYLGVCERRGRSVLIKPVRSALYRVCREESRICGEEPTMYLLPPKCSDCNSLDNYQGDCHRRDRSVLIKPVRSAM